MVVIFTLITILPDNINYFWIKTPLLFNLFSNPWDRLMGSPYPPQTAGRGEIAVTMSPGEIGT
jgi:hypothetical protein